MDREHHLLYRGFKFKRGDSFGNQLRSLRTDDVYAQDLTVLGIGDNLDEALVRANDRGLRVGRERELADLYLVALLLGLSLGQPNAADLRFGIGAARNAVPLN